MGKYGEHSIISMEKYGEHIIISMVTWRQLRITLFLYRDIEVIRYNSKYDSILSIHLNTPQVYYILVCFSLFYYVLVF